MNELVGDLLITPKELTNLLRVSRAHYQRLCASGKIGPKAVRLGRKILFKKAEILRWIDCSCPDYQTWQAMTKTVRKKVS